MRWVALLLPLLLSCALLEARNNVCHKGSLMAAGADGLAGNSQRLLRADFGLGSEPWANDRIFDWQCFPKDEALLTADPCFKGWLQLEGAVFLRGVVDPTNSDHAVSDPTLFDRNSQARETPGPGDLLYDGTCDDTIREIGDLFD